MRSSLGRAAFTADQRVSALSRRELLALAALGLVAGPAGFAAAAEEQGQLTWGVHVSLAPSLAES